MGELTIREMGQDEEFAAWFGELLEMEIERSGTGTTVDDRYLVLTSEIGDWIGGLRYFLRGGVAHLVEVAVTPEHRHQGHAHRLLAAFEERAIESNAHLAEFWTDDERSEGLLGALGWRRVMVRENYYGGTTWLLMEKSLASR
jgi:ribosomal protein S18 acetylase RimI-like enzyme